MNISTIIDSNTTEYIYQLVHRMYMKDLCDNLLNMTCNVRNDLNEKESVYDWSGPHLYDIWQGYYYIYRDEKCGWIIYFKAK